MPNRSRFRPARRRSSSEGTRPSISPLLPDCSATSLFASAVDLTASSPLAGPSNRSRSSPRRVRPSDVIELAFYWRLLEPLRSVEATPAGWVFLRSPDGSMTERRIEIPAVVFAKLDAAISAVREARINGVPQNRFCRSAVCGGIKRDEVRRRAISAQDVSTVMGVGRSYAAALRACGVDCWTSLLAADPDVLAYKVRFEDSKCKAVSADLVRRWQAHARALLDGEARWVGLPQEFPIPSSYIALDLEYIPETKEVWLIGARVVDPEKVT